MADTTTTGLIGNMLPSYWDDLLLDNLYAQLYLYQFGEKRTVPKGSGITFYIPRWKKANITAATTEGSVIGTSQLSSQFISGTLTQFAGAYKHSDVVVMTALSSVIEGSAREISKDLAQQIDTHIRNQISAAVTGDFVGGSGAAASESIHPVDVIKTSDVVKAKTLLNNANNFKFPDGTYGGLIHPLQTFDVQTQTSTNAPGSWVDILKYTGNVETLYRGEVGRMYGVRFVETTNLKRHSSGLSVAAASGATAFIIAPGAYHVVELDGMRPEVIIKPLGSAGSDDPVNQNASVGAKVFFQSVLNNLEVRRIRLITATTL